VSTSFYIAPFDPKAWENPDDTIPKPTSDLCIKRLEYREKLLERWSEITFSHESLLAWRLPLESGQYSGLWGLLQDNQQIVSFGTGPKKSFVDFILWHRSVVPEEYQLFLFNSSSWDSLILTRTTTEQDIIDFTGIIS
jgi:hypothetical protein